MSRWVMPAGKWVLVMRGLGIGIYDKNKSDR